MYICTYINNKKLSPRFSWVSKFDVKLGVGEYHFRNYPMYVSFQIFGSKSCLFSFHFLLSSAFFLKISKTLFAIQNCVLKFAFETHVHSVLLEIILALTNFIKDLIKLFT